MKNKKKMKIFKVYFYFLKKKLKINKDRPIERTLSLTILETNSSKSLSYYTFLPPPPYFIIPKLNM